MNLVSSKGMGRGLSACLALLAFLFLGSEALAQRIQYGPRTNYSADEIANAVRNSGLNPTLMADADLMGNLGRFESGGNAGIFNGSCCTGIFQLNTTNLRSFGLTREQYANMSLQDQTNIWAQLTNRSMGAGPIKQLNGMTTFDGQPVDGAMKMACIQLGTGNCQKMLRSGSCSGFADKNGTTICDMAKSIRDGKKGKATGGGGGCQTPSDSGKKDGDGSGEPPPAGQQNSTVPCKSATDGGGGGSKTCDANMKLQSGIQCSNFQGSMASFCAEYKPKLMTRSDCESAEKYAQEAKKGDREKECKNQTFGRGTGSWSYVLACAGTPSNQGEKGNTPEKSKDSKTETPKDGEKDKDGKTPGSGGSDGKTPGSEDGSTPGDGGNGQKGLSQGDLAKHQGSFLGDNEHCVALSKTLGKDENGRPLGPASGWSAGTTITADNWQQYQGQAVATSNDGGNYARNGGYTARQVQSGMEGAVYSHTGILTGWDSARNTPILFDQYVGGPAAFRPQNPRYGSFSTIRQR